MTAPNPSAFPTPEIRDDRGCGIVEGSPGMTLRDWFASQVLTTTAERTLYHGLTRVMPGSPMHPPLAAEAAYAYADAMLAEREKVR